MKSHQSQPIKDAAEMWGGGGFPGGTVIKNPPASAGDTCSIPGPEDPTCFRAVLLLICSHYSVAHPHSTHLKMHSYKDKDL